MVSSMDNAWMVLHGELKDEIGEKLSAEIRIRAERETNLFL